MSAPKTIEVDGVTVPLYPYATPVSTKVTAHVVPAN